MSALGHVVLVGLSGSGKTTVAPLLAARLRRRCIDTDAEVERHLGMSVEDVFAQLGEPRFRAVERRVAEAALSAPDPVVISAGGGLIAQPGVLEVLRRRATVVCLDATDGELAARVGADRGGRPLLGAVPVEGIRQLRAARAAAHGDAQMHVRTDGRTPQEVAGLMGAALEGALRVGTTRPYLVRVGPSVVDDAGAHLPPTCRRVALIADTAVSAVSEAIAARLRRQGLSATVFGVRGGETAKRWSVAGRLLESCSEAGLSRDDCVVAVGGGSVGDLAGLVAAIYMRGIAWVVVPTTLLAMVDSAVGGKTAVNLRRGKNLAGAFWQPRAVLCDPEMLDTLGDRSFRSAFAEIVKSSMVGGVALAEVVDRRLPAALERDREALTDLVRACCALKAEVVAGDERESGRRAILNYGHTVGHAVETLTGLGSGLNHGEAVAFGMRVAGALSMAEADCPEADIRHQDDLLDACRLRQRPRLAAADITAHLHVDKKARGGIARWVLLRARGEPVTGIVINPEAVRGALDEVLAA